jgi:GNAT superfamily N-acetyltransferase
MTIRAATEEDLPAILDLLSVSLGEAKGIRTEAYWRWKHQRNPFGVSPVLLALEDDRLIGLRAFMRWRFRYQGNAIQAYRAVDTATHPDHQGKGIFTKLTLSLIDKLMPGEPSVIFNTPNKKSLPGYIKMGWKPAGKTRLYVRVYPLNLLRHLAGSSASTLSGNMILPGELEPIFTEWTRTNENLVLSDYSPGYLRWRYQDIPGIAYRVKLLDEHSHRLALIYRLKKSGRVLELRLTEIFWSGSLKPSLLRKAIHELAEEFTPDAITILTDPHGVVSSALPLGFLNMEKRGLAITCRRVNDDRYQQLALDQHRWFLSAGTLELF